MDTKVDEFIKKTSQQLELIGFIQPITISDYNLIGLKRFFEDEQKNSFPFANQILIYHKAGIGINLELNWWGEGEYFDETLFELLHKLRIYSKNYQISNIAIEWEYGKDCNVSFELNGVNFNVPLHPFTKLEELKSVENIVLILDTLNKIGYNLNFGSQLILISNNKNADFRILEISNGHIIDVNSTLQILNSVKLDPKNKESFKWGRRYPQFWELIDSSNVGYFCCDFFESCLSDFVNSISKNYPTFSMKLRLVLENDINIIHFNPNSTKSEFLPKENPGELSTITATTSDFAVELEFNRETPYLFNALNYILEKLNSNKKLYLGYRGPKECQRSELESCVLVFHCSEEQLGYLEEFLYYNPKYHPYDSKYTFEEFERKFKIK